MFRERVLLPSRHRYLGDEMKNRAVFGLITAAYLIAGSATAEPLQSFVDTCLATNGEPAAVAAAAEAGDWFKMPAEVAEAMGEDFREPAIYLNFDPTRLKAESPAGPIEMLMTGWGDGKSIMEIDGLRLDFCGLASPEADSRTLDRDMTARLGFSSITRDDMTFWLFSRQSGGFVSEAALMDSDDKSFVAAAQKRKIYALYIIEQDDMAGLVLGAVRPAP
ncbi:hypothetical protein ACIQTU_14690 [Brevundimonas sp. NPDC090276]|uniref:hypothetical protein n=1 Tax=Brevundimonas sp. NPDC090276 TaxID=3363956 RepID=UPI00383B1CFC